MYTEKEIEAIKNNIDVREMLAYAEQLTDTFPYEYPVVQELLLLAIYVTEQLPQPDSDIIDNYMSTEYESDLIKLDIKTWTNVIKLDNTLRELLIIKYEHGYMELDYTYAISCMHFYLISGILVNYLANNKLIVEIPIDNIILQNIIDFIRNY